MCRARAWAAAAIALLVLSSCWGASAAEGSKWGRETFAPFSYPTKTTNTWEQVTSVLKKEEENGTFPGIYN